MLWSVSIASGWGGGGQCAAAQWMYCRQSERGETAYQCKTAWLFWDGLAVAREVQELESERRATQRAANLVSLVWATEERTGTVEHQVVESKSAGAVAGKVA